MSSLAAGLRVYATPAPETNAIWLVNPVQPKSLSIKIQVAFTILHPDFALVLRAAFSELGPMIESVELVEETGVIAYRVVSPTGTFGAYIFWTDFQNKSMKYSNIGIIRCKIVEILRNGAKV